MLVFMVISRQLPPPRFNTGKNECYDNFILPVWLPQSSIRVRVLTPPRGFIKYLVVAMGEQSSSPQAATTGEMAEGGGGVKTRSQNVSHHAFLRFSDHQPVRLWIIST